jgi:hypothetical protein
MWVTFLPMIYTVLVWLFYNWMITGDPLYFMDSGYSISAYANYYSGYGGYTGALIYVWQRSWPFFMLIGGVLLVRFFSKRFLKIDTLIFLILALGNILFIYDRIAKNLSAGYVRYFCYPFIVAIAWLPYELSEMKGIRRRFSVGIVSGTLALTMIFFAWAFQYSETMREDTLLMVPGNSGEVADYINSNLKNEKILMDSYRTYYVVMNINNINNVVTSCNPDFKESVKDPEGNGIDYLVVPEKGSYGNMDALNRAYPKLYQNGADWCKEVASIGEFKIYKVLK